MLFHETFSIKELLESTLFLILCISKKVLHMQHVSTDVGIMEALDFHKS